LKYHADRAGDVVLVIGKVGQFCPNCDTGTAAMDCVTNT
jgi:hypothetical protein